MVRVGIIPILNNEKLLNADYWIYKGEGNANVVFSYQGTESEYAGAILRLRKVLQPEQVISFLTEEKLNQIIQHKGEDQVHRAVVRNGDFEGPLTRYYGYHTAVWSRKKMVDQMSTSKFPDDDLSSYIVLGNDPVSNSFIYSQLLSHLFPEKYRSVSILLTLERNFLTAISSNIIGKTGSLKQNLDINVLYGILSVDYTVPVVLPGFSKYLNSDCIAIEIKPKWGFLPNSKFVNNPLKASTCRYCMHLQYKHSMKSTSLSQEEKSVKNSSRFCPLDFFSADLTRIRKSLNNLVNLPSNNLKVFENGTAVPLTRFYNSLSNFFFTGSSGPPELEVGYQKFLDVTSDIIFREKLVSLLRKHQKTLDPFDIENIYIKYLHLFPEEIVTGRLYPDLAQWATVLYEYGMALKDDQQGYETLELPLSLGEINLAILKYLASMTLKDCSIIIKFQKVSVEHQIHYDIHLVDLDPKPYSKIPKYHSLDNSIVEYCRLSGAAMHCS